MRILLHCAIAETERAAALLGAAGVRFLDYVDSGMPGDPANDAPGSLWSSDVQQVAASVAAVLVDEGADAIVVYDEFGIYGHPDHIAVHRAGIVAAAQAGIDTIYETTVDREYALRGDSSCRGIDSRDGFWGSRDPA